MRHPARLLSVALAVLAGTTAYAADVDQLAPPDVATGDEFGHAVAAHGGTVVVGSPFHDQDATDAGTAYVFAARGILVPLQAELRPSDPEGSAHFGASVAVSGDTVVVGAPDDGGCGAAYVFERARGSWSEAAKLSVGTSSDLFGACVAIDGDTIVVGAPGRSSSAGAVLVFVRTGTSWTQQAEISGTSASGAFGTSVGVRGDRLVAGAPLASSSRGIAAVYLRSGTTWSLESQLVPADAASGDETGGAVAIGSSWIAVGAARADASGATAAGAVHVYGRVGGSWTRSARLVAPTPTAGAAFGSAVALEDSALAVGSPLGDTGFTDAGGVDLFAANASGWEFRTAVTVPGAAASDRHGAAVALAASRVLSATPGRGGGAAFAQWGDAEHELTASDGAAGDLLGVAIAFSGDTALVGAPLDDDSSEDSGAAYVFVRSGGAWCEWQKLKASDEAWHAYFGSSVALSGDTAILGAGGRGAAYVFVRSGGSWSERQKLTASDGIAGDVFGVSVALSGDTAFVGAEGDDDDGVSSGSVYVFVRTAGAWTQAQKLKPSDGAPYALFGSSIAVSDATALIGASSTDAAGANSGSAYVFSRTGSVWAQAQKLTASDGAAYDAFGHSVALSGDTALVGAPGDDDNGVESGSAYAFVRIGSAWTQQQKLTASCGAANDGFGSCVAISADTAVVGARGDDDNGADSGAAYVFARSSGVWNQQRTLTASSGAAGDGFGEAVALSGSTALVGAAGSDGAAGAVWVRRVDVATLGQTAKLTGSGPWTGFIGFGSSLAISSETAIVGAPGAGTGSAWVFARTSGTWIQEQRLAGSGEQYDGFGGSVALAGDTAIVGALEGGSLRGAAYVYERAAGAWSDPQTLTAGDGEPGDGFGCAVAISGDTALVGALGDDHTAGDAGSAYVFVRANGGWTLQQKLTASDGVAGDIFGNAVAIDGDTAIVAAKYSDGLRGSAYVFARNGAAWTQVQKFTADDAAPDLRFGYTIALEGDTAVITAPKPGNYRGVAYVFVRSNGIWAQQAQLLTADGCEGDWFGCSAALAGDTAAIGATGRAGTGAVYAFARTNDVWTQRQTLTPSDRATSFGSSVALSRDAALIGAPSSYAAYVMEYGAMTAAPPALPADWTVGMPLAGTSPVSGGTPPYHWRISSGTIPPGIAFDANTGAASGTPTTTGWYSFTVECSDAWGMTWSASRTSVVHAPPSVSLYSLPPSTTGRPYYGYVSSNDGTLPFTWSVSAGSLPVAGTFEPSTFPSPRVAELVGTALSAGSYTFTVRITDAAGATASRELTVTINELPTISTDPLPEAFVDRPYRARIETIGGTGEMAFTGAAPAGLSLGASGEFDGSPSDAGPAVVEAQCTDGVGATSALVELPLDVWRLVDLHRRKLRLAQLMDGSTPFEPHGLELVEDTVVSVTARTPGLPRPPSLRLVDQTGVAVEMNDRVRSRPGLTRAIAVAIPRTGRYVVSIEDIAEFRGIARLEIAVDPPRSRRGAVDLSPLEASAIRIAAVPGSHLMVTIRPSAQEQERPVVEGTGYLIVLPWADGTGVPYLPPVGFVKYVQATIRDCPNRTVTIRLSTDDSDFDQGVVVVLVRGAGRARWRASVRPPRGYDFALRRTAAGQSEEP